MSPLIHGMDFQSSLPSSRCHCQTFLIHILTLGGFTFFLSIGFRKRLPGSVKRKENTTDAEKKGTAREESWVGKAGAPNTSSLLRSADTVNALSMRKAETCRN